MPVSNGHYRQLWAVCHSDLWNSRWFSCCSCISVYIDIMNLSMFKFIIDWLFHIKCMCPMHPHKYLGQSWQIGQLVLGALAHLLPGPLKYIHTWNTALHSSFSVQKWGSQQTGFNNALAVDFNSLSVAMQPGSWNLCLDILCLPYQTYWAYSC